MRNLRLSFVDFDNKIIAGEMNAGEMKWEK